MIKKRIVLAAVAGVLALSGIIAGIAVSDRKSGEDISQTEQSLENTVQEKRQELAEAAGAYNPTTIVLSDTDKDIAESVAEAVGAEVLVTPQGDYATLYLPDGVSIEDVYENDEYKAYVPQMEPDYYVYTSSEGDEYKDGERRGRIAERPYAEPDDKGYRDEKHLD